MLIRGDARGLPLREACVDCVVTSPPYWNLRAYPDHRQIGQEATPDAYVTALAAVFREVWRVLKPDGTVWVNLGDSYTNGSEIAGLKHKDLVGLPWAVAFALRAEGWHLRSDVIWHKSPCMPDPVTDRPTKAHEYLFLLTKQERYYYNADAVREPLQQSSIDRARYAWATTRLNVHDGLERGEMARTTMAATGSRFAPEAGRNKRSVWTIAPEPYSGAHFATMPEKLVEPCVLAGSRVGGLVLDPFVGSGTVVAVAQRLGRRGVGLDLAYQSLARERTAQQGLPFPADDGGDDGVC